MKKSFSFFILAAFVSFAFSSCKKTAGVGGNSSITGKVFVVEYNLFSPLDSLYSGKENIYIIYGDDTYFSDKIESSYDGVFKFPFLKKGKYTIFIYSDCLNCPGGKEVVKKEVEITSNKQTVDVGDLRIIRQI